MIHKRANPKEQRHKYDERIAELKEKASKYHLDIDAINQAYASLDIKLLDQTIKAQEDIVRRHEKVLAIAEKRHAKRTEAQEDHIFAAWHARKPARHVIQMQEPELRRMHSLLHISTPYDSSSTQLEAVEIFAEMNKTKESIQRYASRYKQKNIQELIEVYNKSFNWESQAMLAERIRLRCTAQAKADLEKIHAVDGLTLVGTTRNQKIGNNNTYSIKGKIIIVKERFYDLITFKDSLGQTYSYPLGVTKADVKSTVDAGKAAVEWAKKPKYIHDNNKGFIFINEEHPMDPYYRVAYDNFTRGAMYSSDPVTVHTHFGAKHFADTACHEVGHHIYHKNNLEAEYKAAMAKDPKGKYPTKYAENAATEDFADTIMLINLSQAARERIKTEFPNRYKFIEDNVPGFKAGHKITISPASSPDRDGPAAPMVHLFGRSRSMSESDERRMKIETLFDREENVYVQQYTRAQEENNTAIARILNTKRLHHMEHLAADSGSVNPGTGAGYDSNCALSTITYEMRRRGFNVKAKNLIVGDFESYAWIAGEDYSKLWANAAKTTASATKGKAIDVALSEATRKPGRYHLAWDIDKDNGHMIVAERLNDGTLVLYDPQKDKYYSISDYFKTIKSIDVYRIDNATINTDAIKDIVEVYRFNKGKR